MLTLWDTVDMGAMAMNGYSAFPNSPALLERHHQMSSGYHEYTFVVGSYPSAEKQLVYSTALAEWAKILVNSLSTHIDTIIN